MFLLFFLVIFFFFFCFRRWGPWGWSGPHHYQPQPTGLERARDILAERFARGEITGEEYHERLEQLR